MQEQQQEGGDRVASGGADSMRPFTKVVRPGMAPLGWDDRHAHAFAEIKFSADGRLSICGVIGPKANGDASGGCGQVVDSFRADDFQPAPGWESSMVARFVEVWDRWHLNDMRAGCEHQRDWDTGAEIVLYHWRLDSETLRAQDAAKRDAEKALLRGETVTLTPETLALCALPWDRTTTTPEAPEHYAAPGEHLSVAHVDRKTAGWVRPSEHPDGLLTKPCETCGYRYGTEWKREDVPADVVDFLRNLPDADRVPAWV